MKFTIDESRWRCGHVGPNEHGQGDTHLLNNEGYSCCLGMISMQLGIDRDLLYNKNFPSDVGIENILCQNDKNTPLAADAVGINDSWNLTHEERKKELKDLFAEHGHELEFVNGA